MEGVYRRLAVDFAGTARWLHRQSGPVYDEGTGSWFVARYDQVREVLRHPALTTRSSEHSTADLTPEQRRASAPLEDHFRRWLVFSEDPRHESLRVLVRKALARTGRAVDPHAFELPDDLRGIDLFPQFIVPFTDAAVMAMLGCGADDGPRLGRLGSTLLAYLGMSEYQADVVVSAKAALDELAAYFTNTYLPTGSGPLADGLRQARADDAADADLFAVFTQTLTGGTEPMRTALVEGLAWLTSVERLAAFERAPAAVLAELMRVVHPFHHAARSTAGPVTVGGVVIPAGVAVNALLATANRDPDAFRNPDRIDFRRGDPGRSGRTHLSFGWGRHACPGARLAKQVVASGMAHVSERQGWPIGVAAHRNLVRGAGMTTARGLVLGIDIAET